MEMILRACQWGRGSDEEKNSMDCQRSGEKEESRWNGEACASLREASGTNRREVLFGERRVEFALSR